MSLKKIRVVEEPKALDQEQPPKIAGDLTCTSYEPCSSIFVTTTKQSQKSVSVC